MFGCWSEARICRSARNRRAASRALQRRADDLDRDGVLEQSIGPLGAIDVAHAAFADLLDEPVMADHRSEERRRAGRRRRRARDQARSGRAGIDRADRAPQQLLDLGADLRPSGAAVRDDAPPAPVGGTSGNVAKDRLEIAEFASCRRRRSRASRILLIR